MLPLSYAAPTPPCSQSLDSWDPVIGLGHGWVGDDKIKNLKVLGFPPGPDRHKKVCRLQLHDF